MQMHEVKRPGPGHDRSETTPDRVPAALYSLYRERRRGGRAWGGLERGEPPQDASRYTKDVVRESPSHAIPSSSNSLLNGIFVAAFDPIARFESA